MILALFIFNIAILATYSQPKKRGWEFEPTITCERARPPPGRLLVPSYQRPDARAKEAHTAMVVRVRAMLLALPLPSSLPVRLPSTSFFGPPCLAIAVASSAALVPAHFCPRIISRYLSLDDGDDHDDDDHAVSSQKIGGGVDAAAAVWRSSRTKSRRRSLSIPRSRRNPEGFVVELRFRRRSFHSSSLLSMAAACNSPPPDYRANVGVCLVNSKNEVTLLLDLVVFSGGKQERKKERKKRSRFPLQL